MMVLILSYSSLISKSGSSTADLEEWEKLGTKLRLCELATAPSRRIENDIAGAMKSLLIWVGWLTLFSGFVAAAYVYRVTPITDVLPLRLIVGLALAGVYPSVIAFGLAAVLDRLYRIEKSGGRSIPIVGVAKAMPEGVVARDEVDSEDS